jgi:hypothetical protein
LGGSQFQVSQGTKVCEIPSQWKKAWVWGFIPVSPFIAGIMSKRVHGPGWLGQKEKPYFKNNQSKKD